MSIPQKTLNFIQLFQRVYFEEYNTDAVLSMLAPDIQWAGARDATLYQGYEQVKGMILAKKYRFCKFNILDANYQVIEDLGNSCSVHGIINVRWDNADTTIFTASLRVCAVCCVIENEIKMQQYHISLINSQAMSRSDIQISLEQQTGEHDVWASDIPGGIQQCLNDEYFTMIDVSDGFLSMFGYTREDLKTLFDNRFIYMIYPDDRKCCMDEIAQQINNGNDFAQIEYRMLCKDGSLCWVFDSARLVRRDNTEYFYCTLVDITKQKEEQEKLRVSYERYQTVINQTNDIIFEWDIKRDVVNFSSNGEKLFGYSPVVENFSTDIAQHGRIHIDDLPEFLEKMKEIYHGKPFIITEHRVKKSDGIYVWCRLRATAQYSAQGKPIKVVGIQTDIDEEKRQSQRLLERAQKDALTGLYNKGAVQTAVQKALETLGSGQLDALYVIDIDNFKKVNDMHGHLFGDAVLNDVAAMIRKQFRKADIIGRIGGDEFLVFTQDIRSVEMIIKKATQIIEAFQKIFSKEKQNYNISCSIGIALAPLHGSEFRELFRNADLALYQAKNNGKNRYTVYAEEQPGTRMLDMLPIEISAINETIDSNEHNSVLNDKLVEYVFRILYQSSDVETAVKLLLEIIGRQFDVSRTYIFENTPDDKGCNNTFEWCNEGVNPEIDNLQNLNYERDLGGYLNNFDENGVFYCKDITGLHPDVYAVLVLQGIKSILQCAILDNGEFKGYVGFDECRENRFWTQEQVNVLSFLSEILCIFLLKERAQKRIAQDAKELANLLDNQNSWIYVIDQETYELCYINKKTLSSVPSARNGMKCYQAYFNQMSPCQKCPVQSISQTQPNCTMEIYNPVFDVWSLADASLISWKGKKGVFQLRGG